jgi:hypothetical protein
MSLREDRAAPGKQQFYQKWTFCFLFENRRPARSLDFPAASG